MTGRACSRRRHSLDSTPTIGVAVYRGRSGLVQAARYACSHKNGAHFIPKALTINSSVSERASSGPFQLFPTARVLAKDGVPLALGLDWRGRRAALPRHQTLRALLDWSYGLLAEHEQLMLQRLSIFLGTFSIEAAQVIACGGVLDEVRAVNTLDSLVAKSLVSAVTVGEGSTRYRLLETTRVYASEKLQVSGEAPAVAERHGKYFRRLLRATLGNPVGPHHEVGPVGKSAEHFGNARAGLTWFDVAAPIPA